MRRTTSPAPIASGSSGQFPAVSRRRGSASIRVLCRARISRTLGMVVYAYMLLLVRASLPGDRISTSNTGSATVCPPPGGAQVTVMSGTR